MKDISLFRETADIPLALSPACNGFLGITSGTDKHWGFHKLSTTQEFQYYQFHFICPMRKELDVEM